MKLIYIIKVNNIIIEEKIKEKKQELVRLKANPKQIAKPLTQTIFQYRMPCPYIIFNNTPSANKNIDIDTEVEAALIQVTLGYK